LSETTDCAGSERGKDAQNVKKESRREIDPALRQRLAFLTWRNADPYAGSRNDHNFDSLLMLAVTAGAFLLVNWIATKGLFFFLEESPIH